MSSTNRGSDRHASDFYVTPRHCIRRLLDRQYILTYAGRVTDRPIRFLDCAAGRGRFTEVFEDYTAPFDLLTGKQSFVWHVVEIRPEEELALKARVHAHTAHPGLVHIGDFLEHATSKAASSTSTSPSPTRRFRSRWRCSTPASASRAG